MCCVADISCRGSPGPAYLTSYVSLTRAVASMLWGRDGGFGREGGIQVLIEGVQSALGCAEQRPESQACLGCRGQGPLGVGHGYTLGAPVPLLILGMDMGGSRDFFCQKDKKVVLAGPACLSLPGDAHQKPPPSHSPILCHSSDLNCCSDNVAP